MLTQTCNTCGEERSLDGFYTGKKKCILCTLEERKKSYKENPDMQDRIKKRSGDSRKELKAYVDNVKSESGCSACGDRRIYVLDFHHVNEKNAAISDLVQDSNLEKLQAELKLCIVLCANCHREHHHNEALTKKQDKAAAKAAAKAAKEVAPSNRH